MTAFSSLNTLLAPGGAWALSSDLEDGTFDFDLDLAPSEATRAEV